MHQKGRRYIRPATLASEHNQIIYEKLSAHRAKTLVKSKSMLTEECDVRAFLETRGVKVIETDLGERIQQLDDEPPSHIVGYAATFRRYSQKRSGQSPAIRMFTTLRKRCAAIRDRISLVPKAGMTGANFAIAETGTSVTSIKHIATRDFGPEDTPCLLLAHLRRQISMAY